MLLPISSSLKVGPVDMVACLNRIDTRRETKDYLNTSLNV